MATQSALAQAGKIKAPMVVLFGRDESGRAHASRFAAEHHQAAIGAAAMMGFRALAVQDPEAGELATKTPAGKLFASGKAFVPFVKSATAEALERYAADHPDRVIVLPKASAPKAAGGASSGAVPAMIEASDDQPKDWSEIKVGARVLAVGDPDDGWWEAIVQHVHEGGTKGHPKPMLTLRWEHFEDEAAFVRSISQIAMLHPDYHAGDTEGADTTPALSGSGVTGSDSKPKAEG
ncbi:hypothetical protein [Citreimonas salinaria]|uniref:Uncharacterized protein n=1 Tax=Citreimonas salinaria TaxID=321339 RepID=A0A1H3ISN6_9RHOB|nr:hypothetical protein [Citreimonas salinaria]SDY29884.1 hypothetical protein SAMN05444340_105207 [Citreimonas salinaria]